MDNKLFRKAETVFQADINSIVKTLPEVNLINDLIQLQMFKEGERDDRYLTLVELYNYLGVEKFMGIMDILAGKSIKFPAKDSFKETIEIALCWYYRNYRNYSWDEIKQLISDEDLQSVKLGIKINSLQRFMGKYEEIVDARLRKQRDNEQRAADA